MKKKTQKVLNFLNGMHEYIISNPQFRKKTFTKTETQIQGELRPIIINYLQKFYCDAGYKDFEAKSYKSF